MPDSKRFERDPDEGSRPTVDNQENSALELSESETRPDESFPPFDDPANSPSPAGLRFNPQPRLITLLQRTPSTRGIPPSLRMPLRTSFLPVNSATASR
jgi:hypothetical protein